MQTAVIVGAVRTPLGKRGGRLSEVRPDELLALVIRELVRRSGIDAGWIDDVVVGCVNAVGEQGRNIARVATLAAGLPVAVPGLTLNRMCGSSQQAIHFAAQAVLSGQQSLVLAGGVESMSRVPMGSDAQGARPPRSVSERYELINQGISADRIARHYGLRRTELDEFAATSHRRAAQAWTAGRYAEETMAVPGNGNADGGNADGVVTASLLGPVPDLSGPGEWDQGIRPQSTVETLAGLKPAFGDDGLHHAGNSSQLTDGAAVVAVCGQQQAAQWGLAPMARIVATDVIGVDPTMMLHGVIPVTRRILDRAGLSVDDIDLFEVNEAFASVPLAWLREIGAPADRLNVNGGAIALGHPTGCSGTRIMTTLVHELCRRQGRYGLQVMCIGGGMATATLIEAIQGVHGHGG